MKRDLSKRSTDKARKRKKGRKEPLKESLKPKKLAGKFPEKLLRGPKNPTRDKASPACLHCSRDLSRDERALFVEEEVGRVFCSESCIGDYFQPEVERLEKEYFRRLSTSDLSSEERGALSHLRWLTLQEPDEVWREKTLSGDYRFTLISEFQPDDQSIWCVCVCLLLRGEPSFLYLAFPTRNEAMVNLYRKGERVEISRTAMAPDRGEKAKAEPLVDGLADAWTEDETIRAQFKWERSEHDIPVEEFSLYNSCFEETLEGPDEVWSLDIKGTGHLRVYHFLKHYPDESPGVWYIVVARETDEREQIEILDAFPTRDPSLVEQFRRGNQEMGVSDAIPPSRVVH